MLKKTEFNHPTADEINSIVAEAHRLRSEFFHNTLRALGRTIKGIVYPKGAGTAAKTA